MCAQDECCLERGVLYLSRLTTAPHPPPAAESRNHRLSMEAPSQSAITNPFPRALEKEVATHSSIPAWRIPWTEEPGGLQSVGLQRVGPS